MRLIVARCEVSYIGRLTTVLPEAVRLLMLKADGTFMVWADGGGPNVKPLNWMTPPTVLEEQLGASGELTGLLVRKQRQEDRVEIAVHEVIADIEHELDTLVSLEKEGLERELQ
jgi:endonuclease